MPQQIRSTNKKDIIREKALELFKEYGYDNVTIVQICEAAGVTKRAFYYHFKAKEDLTNDLNNYLGVKAESLLSTISAKQTNVEILWNLMSIYCKHSTDCGPSLIKQIYLNRVQGESNSRFPFSMHLFPLLTRTIEEGQKAGEIKNMAEAEDVAFLLFHGFRGIIITWAAENGAFDLHKEYRRIFDVALGLKHHVEDEES